MAAKKKDAAPYEACSRQQDCPDLEILIMTYREALGELAKIADRIADEPDAAKRQTLARNVGQWIETLK